MKLKIVVLGICALLSACGVMKNLPSLNNESEIGSLSVEFEEEAKFNHSTPKSVRINSLILMEFKL